MTDSKWVPIRDTIESVFAFAGKFIFPALALIAPALGLPKWIGIAAGRWVPALMEMAEETFPEPGSGPMKKAKVLALTQGIMNLIGAEFTGGAAVNFEKLQPMISQMIDQTVAMTNQLAPQIIADDPLLDPSHPSNLPGA